MLSKVISIFLIAIVMSSCNPVKSVLSDKSKLDKVAEVVIRKGYCANDTLVRYVSDTITAIDTINNIFIDSNIEYRNDTAFITKKETRDVVKRYYIHDTIMKVIVDKARISMLESDIKSALTTINIEREKSSKRLKWIVALSLIVGIAIYLKVK